MIAAVEERQGRLHGAERGLRRRSTTPRPPPRSRPTRPRPRPLGTGCPPAAVQVTPHNGKLLVGATLVDTYDSQAAFDTVNRLRSAVSKVPGADALVGGSSAIYLDIQNASRSDIKLIIPIVLVVILIVLGVLLRAVLAPVLLIVSVVVSFAATLGRQRVLLQPRVPLRERRPGVPAVRVHLPGGAGHRLQHLPDDPGAGGDPRARHAGRHRARPGRHGWRDHLGRRRAGGDVHRARRAADRVPRRDRVRGGLRRAARHRSWCGRSSCRR